MVSMNNVQKEKEKIVPKGRGEAAGGKPRDTEVSQVRVRERSSLTGGTQVSALGLPFPGRLG